MSQQRNEPADKFSGTTQVSDAGPAQRGAAPTPTSARPLRSGKKQKLPAVLKTWSWRMTAAYLWVRFMARFLTGHDVIHQIETHWNSGLAGFLSSIGLAPANPRDLEEVLKVGWILTITAFKPTCLPAWIPQDRHSRSRIGFSVPSGKADLGIWG